MVSSKFRHLRRTRKRPKVCRPPPPIPPVPPPAQSYADVRVEFQDWDDDEEDCVGYWMYERRIPLVANQTSGKFEESSPPPCPNVYCTIDIPECENAVGHVDLHVWADTCEMEKDWREPSFEVTCPDPGLPWTGSNNNWSDEPECSIGAVIDFVLYT